MYEYKIEAASQTRELTVTKQIDADDGKHLSEGDWFEVSPELPRFYFRSKTLHFSGSPLMTFLFGIAPLSEDGLDEVAEQFGQAAGWEVEVHEAT